MIENYINKHTIMGMLSKRYVPFENWEGFYKNKDRTKVVVFDNGSYEFDEVNHYYLFDKANGYSSTLLVSHFTPEFFKLSGAKYKEIREARNKWNKRVEIKEEPKSIDEVIELIGKWDKLSGAKYRFNRHSGYDRNFFLNYWENERSELYSLFFYYEGMLVGYSIVSKIQDDNCFRYVIRKVDISAGRNIGLYVDFKTFENIGEDFYINWGASSGKVLKYKMKFPIFSAKKVWFYKEVK